LWRTKKDHALQTLVVRGERRENAYFGNLGSLAGSKPDVV